MTKKENDKVGMVNSNNQQFPSWMSNPFKDDLICLQSDPPLLVYGTIYLPDGSPAGAGVTVNITNQNNGNYTTVTTDASGNYIVDIGNLGYDDGDVINATANITDYIGYNSTILPAGSNTTGGFWMNVTLGRGEAEISVNKTVDRSVARPGQALQYRIYFNNTGNKSAVTVWVNDTLPTWVNYVSNNASAIPSFAGFLQSGRNLYFVFNMVSPGVHWFNINVIINGSAPNGVLVNNVEVNYTNSTGFGPTTYDDARTNITSGVTVPYYVYGYVTTSGGTPVAGATVNITNLDTGESITVTTDASGRYVVNLGNMPSGYLTGDTINGTANTTILIGYNQSTISSSLGGGMWLNITLGSELANITVEKSPESQTAAQGQAVSFRIWYNNTGNATAEQVWINDTLSVWFNYVGNNASDSIDFVSFSQLGQILYFYFENVTVGIHWFWVNVTISNLTPPGTYYNLAELEYHSNNTIRPGSNDTAPVTVTGTPPPPQYIYGFVTDSSGAPVAGATVTVTLLGPDNGNNTGDEVTFVVTTDAAGRYIIDITNSTGGFYDGEFVIGNATLAGIIDWNTTEGVALPGYGTVNTTTPGQWMNFTLPLGVPEVHINKTVQYNATGYPGYEEVWITQVAPTNLTWVMIWFNLTNASAPYVNITDYLPVGINFVDTNASDLNNSAWISNVTWYYNATGHFVQVNLTTVIANETGWWFWILVEANTSTPLGDYENIAGANWTNAIDPTNCTDNATIHVVGAGAPMFNMTKNASYVNTVLSDRDVIYRNYTEMGYFEIWFNNTGGLSTTVWINDTMDGELVFIADNSTDLPFPVVRTIETSGGYTYINYTLTGVPGNETGWWFWIQVQVNTSFSGEYWNNATLDWVENTGSEIYGNASIYVPPAATTYMNINKTSAYGASPLSTRDVVFRNLTETVYSHIWFNNSNATAWRVWINDTVEDGLIYVAHNASSIPYFISLTVSTVGTDTYLVFYFEAVPQNDTGWWFWIQFTVNASYDPVASGPYINNSAAINWTGQLVYPEDNSSVYILPGGLANVTVNKTSSYNNTARSTREWIQMNNTGFETGYFHIWFNNTGSSIAYRVWINDTLPNHLTWLNDNASAVPGYNAGLSSRTLVGGQWVLVFVFDNVLVNNRNWFWIQFRVESTCPLGVRDNYANVTWDNHVYDPANDSDDAQVVITPGGEANLTVNKTSSYNNTALSTREWIQRNNTGTETGYFHIWFNNSGPGMAYTVWINDTLPNHLTWLNDNASAVPGYNAAASSRTLVGGQWVLVFVFNNVPANDTGWWFWIEFRVEATCPIGIRDNYANITWDNHVYNPANDSDRGRVVVTPATTANLTINKTSSYDNTTLSSREWILRNNTGFETGYFHIWFNNSGPGGAVRVWINDTLPNHLTWLSDNASDVPGYNAGLSSRTLVGGRWVLVYVFDNVPVDDDGWWFWIEFRVEATCPLGVRDNYALINWTGHVFDNNTDSDRGRVVIQEAPPAEMDVNKIASYWNTDYHGNASTYVDPYDVYPGDSLYFLIWFNSTGYAADVWINDTLPLFDVIYVGNNASDLGLSALIGGVTVNWNAATRTLSVHLTDVQANEHGWWFWISIQVVAPPPNNWGTDNHTNNVSINWTGHTYNPALDNSSATLNLIPEYDAIAVPMLGITMLFFVFYRRSSGRRKKGKEDDEEEVEMDEVEPENGKCQEPDENDGED